MADKTLKSLNFGGADNYFPLPLVTAADNDKILSVVNGEWAAVEAPSGGGGSGLVDCSDTTATASQILKGYTAGTADGVVTGTLKKPTEASGTYTVTSSLQSIKIAHGLGAVPTGYGITSVSIKGGQTVTVTVTADATNLNLSIQSALGFGLSFSSDSEINWFAYLYA